MRYSYSAEPSPLPFPIWAYNMKMREHSLVATFEDVWLHYLRLSVVWGTPLTLGARCDKIRVITRPNKRPAIALRQEASQTDV